MIQIALPIQRMHYRQVFLNWKYMVYTYSC